MTISTVFNGAALSASLIMAIGAQNTFVLRQGLTRQHIFLTALICSLCDLVLMSIGVAGMGHALNTMPDLQRWMAIFGTVFVLWYGFNAFKKALHPDVLGDDHRERAFVTPGKVILAGLAFSLLNPHALLDTVVLVGSIGAQQAPAERPLFVLGAVGFSFVWFFSLAYGSSKLSHLFNKPLAWRILDILIGFMMLAIAVSLIKMAGFF
ncbi:amino acid transporter [Iodobacter sp. HSC-16F04]|uniref:Amino acid transporter n=1 Tax=Iodobacter violaceini TaxID=3044271 RepID=A0ABX0KQY8_9NEIS|nr:LysE/ArgO family amino acid transporter [Iodobacter violacea]NHQ86312.1 amino acid transporter [Iodobacter violacea]